MEKETKLILERISQLEEEIYNIDVNQINKKIDILFASDILNKKIIKSIENRIEELEKIK